MLYTYLNSELFCFQLAISWSDSNKWKGVKFSIYKTVKSLLYSVIILRNNLLHVENEIVILNHILEKIVFFSL